MATLPNNSSFGVPGTADTITFDNLYASGSSTALFSGADTNMFIDTDPSSAGGLLLNAGTEPGLTIQDSTVFLNAIEPTSQTTAVTNETLTSSGTVFNVMENTGSNGDNALRWAGTWRFNGDTFRRGTTGSRMLLGNNQSGFRFRWVIGENGLDIQSYGTGALTVHHGALDPTGTVLQGLRFSGLVPGNLTGLVGQFGFRPSNLALSSGTFATSSLGNVFGYTVRSLDQNLTGGVTDDDDGSANNYTLYTNTDLRPALIGGRSAGADFTDAGSSRRAVWQVNRFVSLWFADPIWTDIADADNLLLGIANNNGASDGSPAEVRIITTHRPSYIDNATDTVIDNVKIRYAKPFRYKAENYASGTVPDPITTDGTTSGTVALNSGQNQTYNGFLILDSRYYIAPANSTEQSPLNLPQPQRPTGSAYVVRIFTHDAPYANTLLPNSATSTTNDITLSVDSRVNDVNAYLNSRAFNAIEIDAATTLTDFADIFPALRQVWYNDTTPSMTESSFGLTTSGTTIGFDKDVSFSTTGDTAIVTPITETVEDTGFTVQFEVAAATGITFQQSSGFTFAQINAAFAVDDVLRLGGVGGDQVTVTSINEFTSFIVINFSPNPLALTAGETIEKIVPAAIASYVVSMDVDPVVTSLNKTYDCTSRTLVWDSVKVPTGGVALISGTHSGIGNLTDTNDASGFISWTATGDIIINADTAAGDIRNYIGNVGGSGTITLNNTSGTSVQLDNVGLLPSTLTINAGTDVIFSSALNFTNIGGATDNDTRIILLNVTDGNPVPGDLLAASNSGFEVDTLSLTTSGTIISADTTYEYSYTRPGFNVITGTVVVGAGTTTNIALNPVVTPNADLTALTTSGSAASIDVAYVPLNIPQNGFEISGFIETTHPDGSRYSRPNIGAGGIIYNGLTGITVGFSSVLNSGTVPNIGSTATAPYISLTNNTGSVIDFPSGRMDATFSIAAVDPAFSTTDPNIRLVNSIGNTIFTRSVTDGRVGTYLITDRSAGTSTWGIGEEIYLVIDEQTELPYNFVLDRFSMRFDNNLEVYSASTDPNHIEFKISGAQGGSLSTTETNNLFERGKANPAYGESILLLGLDNTQQLLAHTSLTQSSLLEDVYFIDTGEGSNQQKITNLFEQGLGDDGLPNGIYASPVNNRRIGGLLSIDIDQAAGITFSDLQVSGEANVEAVVNAVTAKIDQGVLLAAPFVFVPEEA